MQAMLLFCSLHKVEHVGDFLYAIEKEFTFDFILFPNRNANYIRSLEELRNEVT